MYADDVTECVLDMHADQRCIDRLHIALHHRDMHRLIDAIVVAVQGERAMRRLHDLHGNPVDVLLSFSSR